jgi:integrase
MLGRKLLDEVDRRDIDGLMTAWSATAMPRTVNARLVTLLRMFSLAVEWKMIASAPDASSVKVPKDTPRFLSEDEAARLLEAARFKFYERSAEWRSMILVGLRTGMRVGELRGLQWGDLDLSRGVVHVQRTDPGNAKMEAGSPKGGRGRVIPLTPDALACLRAHKESELSRIGDNLRPSSWVWPGAENWRDQHNRQRTRTNAGCQVAMQRITERAGIDGASWHTLRHTFASWLVIRGVPLRVVQELLGHASIQMTERYAHLAPGAVNHAVVASLDVPLLSATIVPALPEGEDEE